MNDEKWVRELVWRLGSAEDEARIIDAFDVRAWPNGALTELIRLGMLVEFTPSSRVVCPDCEGGHVEEIRFSSDVRGANHALIPCPESGRVEIDLMDLHRWRIERHAFAAFVRTEAGLEGSFRAKRADRFWSLGMIHSGQVLREVVLSLKLEAAEGHLGEGPLRLVSASSGGSSDVFLGDVLAWNGTTLSLEREELRRRAGVVEITGAPAYVFRRDGDGWVYAFGGEKSHGRDLKGMEQIHRLLMRPNEQIFMGDMVSLVECGLDQVDAQTLAEVRRLTASGEASARQLKSYLSSVTRIDGSPRRTATAMTRAVNATRNTIDRAVSHIRDTDIPLADHLDRSIRKGLTLSYQTEMSIDWETS